MGTLAGIVAKLLSESRNRLRWAAFLLAGFFVYGVFVAIGFHSGFSIEALWVSFS